MSASRRERRAIQLAERRARRRRGGDGWIERAMDRNPPFLFWSTGWLIALAIAATIRDWWRGKRQAVPAKRTAR